MTAMDREIRPSKAGRRAEKSDFMRLDSSAPVPGRMMSNIDRACGQY
jgi:hypothetical protein